jgi:hypothetical protein
MAIWLDIESGTWGEEPFVILDTDGWDETDWITFDIHMSDRQRSEYGEMCRVVANPDSPLAWYAETCVE